MNGADDLEDPPDANTSYNVTPEELFDLFGKFGPVRYVQSWSDMLMTPRLC